MEKNNFMVSKLNSILMECAYATEGLEAETPQVSAGSEEEEVVGQGRRGYFAL